MTWEIEVKVELSNKAIHFVLLAIETEKRRLEGIQETSGDEDEVADASNDLGFYRAIESDLKRALADVP